MAVALLVETLNVVLGGVLGLVAGYFGGVVTMDQKSGQLSSAVRMNAADNGINTIRLK